MTALDRSEREKEGFRNIQYSLFFLSDGLNMNVYV